MRNPLTVAANTFALAEQLLYPKSRPPKPVTKQKLFWVEDARWETEQELVARLRDLPKDLTMTQMAMAIGLSPDDRDPGMFVNLLQEHDIEWRRESQRHRMSYSGRYWNLNDSALLREAERARKQEIAAARRSMEHEKEIYRKWA